MAQPTQITLVDVRRSSCRVDRLHVCAVLYYGVELRFEQFWDALITIVQAILPLFGSIYVAHIGYERAKAAGVPLLGYSGKPVSA